MEVNMIDNELSELAVHELKIDPEFQSYLRPLSNSESSEQEASLRKEGCRDPIATRNGYIIDGHNRYEICTKHNIPFRIIELKFSDREEVIQWIIQNQLARRNLTNEEFSYFIGKIYESEKKSMGGNRSVQNTTNDVDWSNVLDETNVDDESKNISDVPSELSTENLEVVESTAKKIALRHNISESTVKRDYDFTKGVDIIDGNVPGAKAKILSGEVDMSKKDIIALAEAEPKVQIRSIERNLKGEKPKIQTKPKVEKKSQMERLIMEIEHLNKEDFYILAEAIGRIKDKWNLNSDYSRTESEQTQEETVEASTASTLE